MQEKDSILICDLTHTGSKSYSPNLIPYPIGCIKSYCLEYSKFASEFEIEIFKDPQEFIDAAIKKKSSIIGFGNYVWNLELSTDIAKEIKSMNPETLIVFGGPNFPLEDTKRIEWLKERPFIDIYVTGDGEENFTKIVDSWYQCKNIEKVKEEKIPGCYSLVNNELYKTQEFSSRIEDLDIIPSPYLKGYLDRFLENPRLSPLIESNRGCPFTCTFCVDGNTSRTKVFQKSVSRFEQEMEYIATHYKGKMLTIADLNFGMFSRDIDISTSIAKMKEKYDYPYYIQVSAGKNNKPRILECAKILDGSMSLAASVQSLDKEVLEKVKRNNISEQQLLEMTKAGNELSANTYSEVILALPGDSKEKHFKTVLKLADSEINIISMYQCMILEGSELGSNFSKKSWNMQTKYRVLPRCFGIYNFGEKEILSAEIEEICVSTGTLPIEDYYESRSFALTIGLFYQDRILLELYQYLRNFDIRPSELLQILHKNRMSYSKGITELYQSFDYDTKHELWDNKEDVRKIVKKDKEVLEKYARGELGVNVLFKHRAIVALELIKDIHDAAFSTALELLKERAPGEFQESKEFLEELKTFSYLRKTNVFDYEQKFNRIFSYDFEKLIGSNFKEYPIKLKNPINVQFFADEKQKIMIKEKIEENGSDVNGIGKILSKMLGNMLQRKVKFESRTMKENILENMEISTSPGEFV
jgi:radical SAM superfamily enzyme YgiQ (UPF0313 family)